MVHLGYLNYTQYQINVSFKGLENVTYDVKVNFMVSCCSPANTGLSLALPRSLSLSLAPIVLSIAVSSDKSVFEVGPEE